MFPGNKQEKHFIRIEIKLQIDTNNMNRQQQNASGGMPCPACNGFIPISMYQILTSPSVFCPICGLRLDINKPASSKAINALKNIAVAQKEVERCSKFNR